MITANAVTSRFTLLIDAPALTVGILVVQPSNATATFLFFLCHKLFELNDENILV